MDKSLASIWQSPGLRHGVKVAVLVVLLLLLLIPLRLVRDIIESRQELHAASIREIADQAGGQALLAGPLIRVPVDQPERTENGSVQTRRTHWYAIADEAEIDTRVDPQLLRRGIYEAPVYTATVDLTALIPARGSIAIPTGEDATIRWDEAELLFAISRLDGLRVAPAILIDGAEQRLRGVSGDLGTVPLIGLPITLGDQEPQEVSLSLEVHGGGSISWLPTAARGSTTVSSPWPDPGFRGRQLPSTRTITQDGFTATWTSSALGLGIAPVTKQGEGVTSGIILPELAFGVELYQPVDRYQRVLRSVKYGALFILLPFVAIFLMEIWTGRRVHPIQYLLIASAKIVFYLVLLSLSEHLAFTTAYAIASGATIGLLAVYLFSVLSERSQVSLMTAIIAAEYLFLYSALVSQEYALLIGSLGLFAVIAITMIATRKIDWYAPQAKSRMEPRTK